MRKIFWGLVLFGVYVWLLTSGRDRLVIEQGKAVYEAVVAWFDDAELDFQTTPPSAKEKKRGRRWD